MSEVLKPDACWETWMRRAQEGDALAYDRLLRAMLPWLRGIARRWIRDPSEAEDALQDTLLTIHRLRHAWDPDRPLRPWLATLCERRCIDRLRRRAHPLRRTSLLDLVQESALAEAPKAFSVLEAAELRRAIAALPATQRVALSLAKLSEMPLTQAAAMTGHSTGSLKVATHRAVRALRRSLAPHLV